jgi:outer membrane protein TolC
VIGTVTAIARLDTVLCVAAWRRLIPMLVLASASSVLAAAVVRAAPPPPPLELSLDQALQLGLERSLAVAGRAVLVRQGEALVGLTQTRFLPKLDLLALGSYIQLGTSASQVSNLPAIGTLNLNLGANGYAVAQNMFGDLGLSLTFPLLDFGRGPQRQAAQATLAAARADRSEQMRGSRFAITAAYLDLQVADALLPVWQQALQLSQTLQRDSAAIRRRGLAARIDTLQARTLVERDRAGLSEARSQQQIARSALARLLNLPAEQAVRARDPLLPAQPWPLGLDDSLQRALAQRPLLEALAQQRQVQLQRQREARALMLPSVGLQLGAGYGGNSLNLPVLGGTAQASLGGIGAATASGSGSGSFSGGFYNWGGFIGVRQPLFDGGLSRESARLAGTLAELRQLDLDQARQTIVQNVQTWYATHQAAGEQIKAAQAAVQAGEQAVRDAQLRYRAQVAPILEVLIAQRDLQAARSAQAVAIQRWNLSRAGLLMEADSPDPAAEPAAGCRSDRGGCGQRSPERTGVPDSNG